MGQKIQQDKKIALVLSGGGMKCAYTAGVLTGFMQAYPRFMPDIIIAESGAAGSATYFAAGQERHGLQTWLSLGNNKKFFSFWRRPMMDVDYLVDTIFKAKHPFDLSALQKSTIDIVFPVLNVRSGMTEYISPKPPRDTYAAVRAAKAIPVLYGKSVRIDGNEYVDGGLGSFVSDHVLEAERRGATHIIVVRVDDGPRSWKGKLLRLVTKWWRYTKQLGLARASEREFTSVHPVTAHNKTDIITLVPTRPLPLSLVTTGRLAIRTAINQGYDDLVKHPEIETLLRS
ncbi:MAG: patatin-like phospholipase family protein [Patescibacteria group bacterium]